MKLFRTLPLHHVIETKVSSQFVNSWVFSYGAPIQLIAYKKR